MSIRTSPLTCTELQNQFGVTRPMVRSVIYNRFSIPADYRICMKYYRMKHLTGKQFTSFMTNDGELRNPDPVVANIKFTIIYQDCTPVKVKRAGHLVISFRIPDDSFNIEPVAIVRISTATSGTCAQHYEGVM